MERKVNRVGQNTLTVSLPVKWVKDNNIKQGEEIELIEEGKKLIIGGEYKPKSEVIEIDVTNQGIMNHRILAAIYKAGFDQAEIKFKTSEEFKIIQDRLERNLAEFDVIDYKKDRVLVRSSSKLNPKEFESTLKRCFYSLKDTTNSTYEALKNNDYNEMKNIVLRDLCLDKYADYCRRLLNKDVETKYKRTHALYYLIEEIEIIGDMYKDICNYISKEKLKISKQLIDLFGRINDFSNKFVDTIIKFDFEKIQDIGKERVNINNQIDFMLKKVNKNELKIFLMIVQIFNATFEMKSALLTLKLK